MLCFSHMSGGGGLALRAKSWLFECLKALKIIRSCKEDWLRGHLGFAVEHCERVMGAKRGARNDEDSYVPANHIT